VSLTERELQRAPQAPSTRLTLLTRLKAAGDGDAWRLFVDLYTPVVYRYCRSRSLQDADARDVAQQVLAIVMQAIENFEYDPQRGRFRDWLGTIALHELLRNQRKDRRAGKGIGAGQGDWATERLEGPVDSAWLEEFNAYVFATALERIRADFDPADWQAFDSTWLGEVKPQDAAVQLGTTTAWIYKARYRVLQRLRAEIEFLTNDSATIHKPR